MVVSSDKFPGQISRTDQETNPGLPGQTVDRVEKFRGAFPGQISRTNPIDRIRRDGSGVPDMGDPGLKTSRTSPSMMSVNRLSVAGDVSRTARTRAVERVGESGEIFPDMNCRNDDGFLG